jgi:hypothetical protein
MTAIKKKLGCKVKELDYTKGHFFDLDKINRYFKIFNNGGLKVSIKRWLIFFLIEVIVLGVLYVLIKYY